MLSESKFKILYLSIDVVKTLLKIVFRLFTRLTVVVVPSFYFCYGVESFIKENKLVDYQMGVLYLILSIYFLVEFSKFIGNLVLGNSLEALNIFYSPLIGVIAPIVFKKIMVAGEKGVFSIFVLIFFLSIVMIILGKMKEFLFNKQRDLFFVSKKYVSLTYKLNKFDPGISSHYEILENIDVIDCEKD